MSGNGAPCRGCTIADCAAASLRLDETAVAGNIALAGNPNVGKTSVFNALTGLRQHTGNWPGKTVLRAEGMYRHDNSLYRVIDLPGTYSLSARSAEEEVARDFICFASPDVTVVVVDATSLERNLNLALQTAEITDRILVCVNLLDEAARKGITVDLEKLSNELGIPTVGTVARTGRGIDDLKNLIHRVATGAVAAQPQPLTYPDAVEKALAEMTPDVLATVGDFLPPRWVALRLLEGDETLLNHIAAHVMAHEMHDPVTPPVAA